MQRFAFLTRDADVSGRTLAGHAAVFGTAARLRGHLERMDPAAFDDVLKTADVRFLVNHDANLLLGRSSSGTLKLGVDKQGLAYEVELPDTQLGHDTAELVRRRDLDGGSFGFIPGLDRWERTDEGVQVRTHTKVRDLLDVSVVTYPAYDGTDVMLRAMELVTVPANGRSQLVRARARMRAEGKLV